MLNKELLSVYGFRRAFVTMHSTCLLRQHLKRLAVTLLMASVSESCQRLAAGLAQVPYSSDAMPHGGLQHHGVWGGVGWGRAACAAEV